MITRRIDTRQYDVNLFRLLKRRLEQHDCPCALASENGAVAVSLSEDALLPLTNALITILINDLRYFELARMIDETPLTLPEKQQALTCALDAAQSHKPQKEAHAALLQYLRETERLNLEGYLRFRMGDSMALWRVCAEREAAEAILRREYAALLGTFHTFANRRREKAGELSVCIHPDLSCTLTDDSDACIEYVDCSEDGVVSLLIGMAPAFLTVYDLSGGSGKRLTEAIQKVFAGRVKVYR